MTWLKVIGVLVCFLGAICVGLQDEREGNSDGQQNSVFGDVVALLAAAGYGLYTTMIRREVVPFPSSLPGH